MPSDKSAFASRAFTRDRSVAVWGILSHGDDSVCLLAPYSHRRPLSQRSVQASLRELDMLTELAARVDINNLDCVSHLAERARQKDFDCTVERAARMRKLMDGEQQLHIVTDLAKAISAQCIAAIEKATDASALI
jgi:hypothetical protein